MLNLYCIFVYSVIDPSGTNIIGWSFELSVLASWRGGVGTRAFGSLQFFSVHFFPFISTLCGHFTGDVFRGFDIWNRVLRISVNLACFSLQGMRGHAELWRLGSDDFCDIYIYMACWYNPCGCRLQMFVVVCVVLCLSVLCCFWINCFNLISPVFEEKFNWA